MGRMATQTPVRLVVITGMSGAGRRSAAHVLEDLGWYMVDNLPPSMLPQLIDNAVERQIEHVACILDVRSRSEFDEIPMAFARLGEKGVVPQILYIDASDEVIIKRQEHVRRPHPLQGDGPMLVGVQRERELLATLRAAADLVIDTSSLNVRQLADRVINSFNMLDPGHVRFTLMSFGFKRGVPIDADMMFDVRFLPNPHWIPELRPLNGLSEPVSSFVLASEAAEAFLSSAASLLISVAPGFLREGKRLSTVAIGCTGGKHRSTAMTEELAKRLRAAGLSCHTMHRDLGLE